MGYCFSADEELCITSWGGEIAEITGKCASLVLGQRYDEILPRIGRGDEDAIAAVIEKKTAIALKGYRLSNCLFGQMTVDIHISPIGKDGTTSAAEITIVPDGSCSVMQKLQDLQRFIDIGKKASALAHGVRNPLNAIKGAVIYLRDKYTNEPTLTEFTKIMEDEISRLDGFLSRFLSTSVSEGRLSLTNINERLDKIRDFTSFQAQASGIRTAYEYGDISPIMADPFQIEQAILNVVSNALEAMPAGGDLSVRTGKDVRNSARLIVIEVSDTGPGFAETKIDTLNTKEHKGRGFGLFITQEILKHHGGYLEVKGRKGVGTTVLMFLPEQRW